MFTIGGTSDANLTRQRYNRLAPFYDLLEAPMEWFRFASWRARLSHRIVGERVLEVGVGTGKNLPYYPQSVKVTAVDVSPRMLGHVRPENPLLGFLFDVLNPIVVRIRVYKMPCSGPNIGPEIAANRDPGKKIREQKEYATI